MEYCGYSIDSVGKGIPYMRQFSHILFSDINWLAGVELSIVQLQHTDHKEGCKDDGPRSVI
jgi:hypothetical protein